MVIITKYDIGDTIKCGPVEGVIIGLTFYSGLTYAITYWDDNRAVDYTAYEWELQLVEKFNKDK